LDFSALTHLASREAFLATLSDPTLDVISATTLVDPGGAAAVLLKFHRGGEIVIVTHGGAGWLDPLSEAKGGVFALASLLERCGLCRLRMLCLAREADHPARAVTQCLVCPSQRGRPAGRSMGVIGVA